MLLYNKLCCDFCQAEIEAKENSYNDENSGVCLCHTCLNEYRDFLHLGEENIFCVAGEFNVVDSERSCKYMNMVLNGFHDFHLLGVHYENNGLKLTENGGLEYGFRDDTLTLRFLAWSLKDSPVVEIIFSHLKGYILSNDSDSPYEVFDASVSQQAFEGANGESEKLFVWSFDGDFDAEKAIGEQTSDCVVAQSVKWRWIGV